MNALSVVLRMIHPMKVQRHKGVFEESIAGLYIGRDKENLPWSRVDQGVRGSQTSRRTHCNIFSADISQRMGFNDTSAQPCILAN